MLLSFVPDTRSSESAVCPVGFISLGKKDILFEHKALSMAELFYTWGGGRIGQQLAICHYAVGKRGRVQEPDLKPHSGSLFFPLGWV